MKCTSFDLPAVEPIARKVISREGLSDRVQTASGDFFKDALPKADMATMGMILHDWNFEKKKHLIRSAYNALHRWPHWIRRANGWPCRRSELG
jgi:hypothetical protein